MQVVQKEVVPWHVLQLRSQGTQTRLSGMVPKVQLRASTQVLLRTDEKKYPLTQVRQF